MHLLQRTATLLKHCTLIAQVTDLIFSLGTASLSTSGMFFKNQKVSMLD